MHIVIRFLLWLIIAALPLQGSAFANMPCMGMDVLAAADHSASPGQHCGDVADVADVAESTAPAAGEQHCAGHDDGSHAADSHGKCSQCASCCIGAVAPPAMPSPVFPAAFSSVAPSAVEAAMIAHVPATPKRPPRLRV